MHALMLISEKHIMGMLSRRRVPAQAIELLMERVALERDVAEAGCTDAKPDTQPPSSPSSSASLLQGSPRGPRSLSGALRGGEGLAVDPEEGGLAAGECAPLSKPAGRKQKCKCGSGRKYKDCCRKKDRCNDRCNDQPTAAQKIIMADHIIMSAAICV